MDNVGEIERYTDTQDDFSYLKDVKMNLISVCCCVPNVKTSVELLPRLTRKYAHRQCCTRLCRNHLLVRMRRRTGNITVRCGARNRPSSDRRENWRRCFFHLKDSLTNVKKDEARKCTHAIKCLLIFTLII